MKHLIKLEDDFLYILVTIYVCLNVKPLKESTYFSYWYILVNLELLPHGEKHPRQEVVDGYIWKKNYDTWYLPMLELT